jgi:hypothetical protein
MPLGGWIHPQDLKHELKCSTKELLSLSLVHSSENILSSACAGLQEEKSKDFGFRVEAGVSLKSSSPAVHLVARTSAHFSSSASDAAATLDFCLRRSACQETPSTFLDSL